jgi:hypothetical protein
MSSLDELSEEFLYVVSGSLSLKVGDERLVVRQGSSVLFGADYSHDYFNQSRDQPYTSSCSWLLRTIRGYETARESGSKPQSKEKRNRILLQAGSIRCSFSFAISVLLSRVYPAIEMPQALATLCFLTSCFQESSSIIAPSRNLAMIS